MVATCVEFEITLSAPLGHKKGVGDDVSKDIAHSSFSSSQGYLQSFWVQMYNFFQAISDDYALR